MSASTTATALRLAAAALAAGALSAAMALPASAADHAPYRPSVEITSVQYDAPGYHDRSNHSLNKEWVDVTNTTRHTLNLDGWTLSDRDGHTYTFHHYRLDGRSSVRIHTGFGHDSRTDLFQDRNREAWDDHSGTVTLRNDHGRVIDASSWGWGHHHGGGHH